MIKTSLLCLMAAVTAVLTSGCAKSELDPNDINALRKQYGKEAYDKAMIAQGKGAEVERQKKEDEARRSEPR